MHFSQTGRTALVLAGALFGWGATSAHCAPPVTRVIQPPQPLPCPKIERVVLEMSPKPFTDMSAATIRRVCGEAFRQWAPLARHADSVAVLLWTADGSEILEYRGRMDDPIEWARYIGHPNPRQVVPRDREKKALHSGGYLYRENPPAMSYRDLAAIVATLKRLGPEILGKPVEVGATFDPGGEFARSEFKYEKHNEICLANTMGKGSFVCCYATLNADRQPYAGFPDGIPQGTPLGTFLGRQSRHFLKDLGFDYLWLSNGFGFGMETWKTTGPLFDGQTFDARRAGEIRGKILQFWKLFRAECPQYRIETRGTNLSVGIDLASNAVPLGAIYRGGFNIEPPPNSPWAALNGDFGLELTGYKTRIAELPPGRGFPFRYYVHDPWWLNSPWLDRYGREPHDIYLPLAVGRLNAEGALETPRSIAILTIDDSYGRMPEQCPSEVIPHILAALAHRPDRPGPTVWVYPFDEYQELPFAAQPRLEEPFFADWFIRAAINDGFPLNTVVSSGNFLRSLRKNPNLYRESILVTSAPDAGSPMDLALLRYLQVGGQALLYGPLGHASEPLLALLNLRLEDPIAGQFRLSLQRSPDQLAGTGYPGQMQHRETMSAGGCREVLRNRSDRSTEVIAVVAKEQAQRVAALARRLLPAGGMVAWVRGTNSNSYRGGHLLTPDDPQQWFPGDLLMRFALDRFGYRVAVRKTDAGQRNPVTAIARHDNGFFFSGYTPNTNVELRLRFPQGAPILTGLETELRDGQACYRLPRAWQRECRVFVAQREGEVSCAEQCSGADGIARRLALSGLNDATVCFYPESSVRSRVTLQPDPKEPFIDGPFLAYQTHDGPQGHWLTAAHVTGRLLISW